jgi:hypothetical protein
VEQSGNGLTSDTILPQQLSGNTDFGAGKVVEGKTSFCPPLGYYKNNIPNINIVTCASGYRRGLVGEQIY